jgi:ferredoxin
VPGLRLKSVASSQGWAAKTSPSIGTASSYDNVKKIVVDKMSCQGYAKSEAVAQALFRLNENRIAIESKQPENEEDLALAKAAVKACPRHAIRLTEGAN